MISSSVISAPSGLCSGIRGLECWDRFVTGFWFPLLHGCVFLYHQYILIGQFLAVWYVYRRASVALNVWQPQVVRGRQKQLVQQCTVSVDSRVSDLNMELKVCKQQIATYKNSYVCDHLFFTTNEQDKNKTSLTIVVSFSATDRTRRSTSWMSMRKHWNEQNIIRCRIAIQAELSMSHVQRGRNWSKPTICLQVLHCLKVPIALNNYSKSMEKIDGIYLTVLLLQ